jgi:hypothetical protein
MAGSIEVLENQFWFGVIGWCAWAWDRFNNREIRLKLMSVTPTLGPCSSAGRMLRRAGEQQGAGA